MLGKICNVLLACVVLSSLAIAAVLGIPIVTGKQLYAVETASMEPSHPVGSIVVVKSITAEEVAINDIITFEAGNFDTLVTHRVIGVDAAAGTFQTKGDNNDSADFYPVPFSSVVGRVEYGIPMLGTLVTMIRTPAGLLILLWIIVLVLLLLFLPDIVSRRRRQRAGAAAAEASTESAEALPAEAETLSPPA